MRASSFVFVVCLVLCSPLSAQVQPAQVQAVDANGKVFGNVMDIDTFVVPILVDSHLLYTKVLTGYPQASNAVYFESTDCSGQGYVCDACDFPRPAQDYLIVGTNASVYFRDSSVHHLQYDIFSRLRWDGSPCELFFIPAAYTDLDRATHWGDLYPALFSPPLHIQGAAVSAASAFAPVDAVSGPGLAITALLIAAAGLIWIHTRTGS